MNLNRNTIFVLAGIFMLGLILRLSNFYDTTFGWDQARDAFESINIWTGDFIKIIGPTTAELPGLHHGSFYWYLISPFYFLSEGSPYVVRFFLILLNLVSVFILYHLTKIIFKNRVIAFTASFLYAVSFEAIQYGRWLSNPSPALLTILATFTGLWLIISNRKWGVPTTLISWALSVHFQFFLLYQFVFIAPVLLWSYKSNKIRFDRTNLFGVISSLLIFLPFAVAEIKFNFQGLKSFSQLSSGGEITSNLGSTLLDFGNRIVNTFYFNIAGGNLVFAQIVAITIIILSLLSIIKIKSEKKGLIFLIIWLLSPIVPLSFGKATAYFLTIGNLFPAVILTSFFLVKMTEKITYGKIVYSLMLTTILMSQITLVKSHNQDGETLFSVQKRMILSDELKVIDYVYNQSNKKPFVINTVTNPLFINTTWSYLFNWYGKPKYGYMPIWGGYPQVGQFGSEIKFTQSVNQIDKDLYLIIEPQPGIPNHIISGVSEFENTRSVLTKRKIIGEFTIEKRRLINNNGFDSDSMYKLIDQYKL